MEQYSKIVESVNVKFGDAKRLSINKSLKVLGLYEIENTLYYVHKGKLIFDTTELSGEVVAGQMLLIPSGLVCNLTYLQDPEEDVKGLDALKNQEFIDQKRDYITEVGKNEEPYLSEVLFKTKVFDSVNFFSSLGIPVFDIPGDETISRPLLNLVEETANRSLGYHRVIVLETERMVINIIRHIIDGRRFVEQLATNITYFKDPRIIKIFNYIKNNISGNLTNQVIAEIADVSEDYVGQYFKGLTGINPQDYIEYQRMEMAVNLLRTTKHSIKDVGVKVGYKDTAYFCRRFKMMFGIPAGKMRKRAN